MSDQPRGMTADQLQAIVLRLANAYHCRYWLMWPVKGGHAMAVQCIDSTGQAQSIRFLEQYEDLACGQYDYLYVIPRLNPDGTPYEGLP
jgi:hypothetical protein